LYLQIPSQLLGKMAARTTWLLAPILGSAIASYTVPSATPSGAAALDPAPVGVSYVFPCNFYCQFDTFADLSSSRSRHTSQMSQQRTNA
jgi:hypothetical protein